MKERAYFMIEGKKLYPSKKPYDKDICKHCRNMGICLRICYPLEWVDGNKARKEALLKEPADQQPTGDYNGALAELMADKEAKNETRLEAIKAIKQPRRKIVMAATLAGMSQKEIALQTHISQGRISRIYQGLTSR